MEAGFFKETYRSSVQQSTPERQGGVRNTQTVIYYLIIDDGSTDNAKISCFKNKSDIVHLFHDGWPVRYTSVSEDGQLTSYILGNVHVWGWVGHLYTY